MLIPILNRKIPVKIVKVKLARDVKHFSVWHLLTFVLVFAGIGGYIIYHSFAYTTPEPTATIIGSDDVFAYGTSPTLTYSATNATNCNINGIPVSLVDGNNFYTAPTVTTDATYTLSCSGLGGTVNASTTVAAAAAPQETTNATNSTQATTHKVNFIRFCATDVCRATPDLETVKNSVRNWYTRKVGKSFSVGDMNLKTVRGNHEVDYYKKGTNQLIIQNVLDKVSAFLNNNGKVPSDNIDTVVLGFPVNDHCGAGFTSWKRNPINRVSNPDNFENVSVTDPFTCGGASFFSDVAHELGHNFGLFHDNMSSPLKTCASTQRNYTLMDCQWACNGNALSVCTLNGRQYGTSVPDWKLLADYSPFFR